MDALRTGARASAIVAALALASCSGGTFVTVTMQATGVTLPGVTRIDLDLQLAGKSASAKLTGNITFPTSTVLDVASGEGMLQITANAVDGSGHIVGQTSGSATVTRGKTTTATLDFANAPGGGGADMAGGPCAICDPAAICSVDTSGTVGCACPNGYSGDGTTCSDIDECATGTAACDPNATCSNTTGGYDCACKPTFGGNGFVCTPIWVVARDNPGFSIGRGNAVGSGNTLYYYSPNITLALVKFQSWDVTSGTAGAIVTETTMPAATNDFCDCGDSSKLLSNNNGTLYYFGNYGQSYNTSTKAWTNIPTYVSPTDHRRGESGIVLLNNLVYWLGDRNYTASVQTYDVNAGTFATATSYPIGIDDSGAAVVNGKIYSFNGQTTGNVSTSTSYVFDPGTSMWTQKANVPTNLFYPDAVGFRNQVWGLYGGRLYIYDPTANTWSNGPALPTGGMNWHMAIAGNSTPALYILGDFTAGMTIYKYNQ